MREIIEFAVHGPAATQIRKAVIHPCSGEPGYNLLVDGKLRYYGMRFDLEQALERIRTWESLSVHVVEVGRRSSSVPDNKQLQALVRGTRCASRFRLF